MIPVTGHLKKTRKLPLAYRPEYLEWSGDADNSEGDESREETHIPPKKHKVPLHFSRLEKK